MSRRPWLLGLALLWSGCASAPAVPAPGAVAPPAAPSAAAALEGCAPWVLHPERSPRPDFMVGVGSAPLGGPDALDRARKGGLADIAQQIRVRVKATELADQRSASANGAESQSQYLRETVKTSADEKLEGASQLDSCQGSGRLYVLMGVSRHRLIAGALDRLQKIVNEVAALQTNASVLLMDRHNGEAAELYRLCAKLAAEAEPLAGFVRIVGQEDPGVGLRAPSEYERLAQDAVGRARIVVPELVAEDGVTPTVAHTLTEELLTQVNRFAEHRQVLSPNDIEGFVDFASAAKKVGASDEAGLGQLGTALSADELVTGTIGLIGSTYLVTLKRFDVRKLSILRQQSKKLATQSPDALLAVVDDLAAGLFPEEAARLRAGGAGGACTGLCLDLDFVRPGGALCPGDRTQASLSSDQAGYAVVFDVFGPDQAMVIFPNPSNPEGRIAAGQKIPLFEGGLTAVPYPGGREETLVAFRADRLDQLAHAAGPWLGPCRAPDRIARALHQAPRPTLGGSASFAEDGYRFLESSDPACAVVAPPPPMAGALAAVPVCR